MLKPTVHLADHEYKTVKLLTENGYDVELIPPSVIKGLRMPDIMINNVPWEIKTAELQRARSPFIIGSLLLISLYKIIEGITL